MAKNQLSERLALALEQMGYTPDKLATPVFSIEPPACDVCKDMGYISYAVPQSDSRFGRLFPCDNPTCVKGNETRRRYFEGRYSNAKIPPLYAELTFESWQAGLTEDEKAGKWLGYSAAWLFAHNKDHYMTRSEIYEQVGLAWDGIGTNRPKNSICFTGAVGTGKTGYCSAAANVLLDQRQTLLYIRVVDLIEAIKARFKADEPPTSEDVIRDFQAAPLLWLDEFNVALDTDYRREVMETIMRHRYANRLPTLITTNLSQDEFYKAWGERCAEAVLAMCQWIPVTGLKLRETEQPLSELDK